MEMIDKHEVYGDVVYLENKGLIKGTFVLGSAHPPWIIITSYGIDFVENVINQSIETLDSSNLTDSVKKEIREISNELSPSVKIKRVVEYAQLQREPWVNIVKIAKDRFYN
jgi:hypothetical protein